jgi:hypothetical protein
MNLSDLVRDYDRTHRCNLDEDARSYHDRCGPWAGLGPEARREKYVSDLLPRELDFARFRHQHSQGVRCLPDLNQPVDCLVLLVGHSFDPLLQALVAYQPRTVLLLLAREYGDKDGQDHGDGFRTLVEGHLAKALYPSPSPAASAAKRLLPTCPPFLDPAEAGLNEFDLEPVVEDRPGAVFRWLQTVLLEKRDWLHGEIRQSDGRPIADASRIVLDITGAKKSMVAGAFLFAAFAQTDISYVDFDKYNDVIGQPFGYSCRIGFLENPYEMFRIREWERVVELYDNYQFGAARSLLEGILTSAGAVVGGNANQLFAPVQQAALERLLRALSMYHLWENGDYHGAKEQHEQLVQRTPDGPQPPKIPWAVETLHARWPDVATQRSPNQLLKHTTTSWETGDDSLYLNHELLLAYAYDEREKIKHLIDHKHDYRSAFLRAHGLSETLLKARIMRLWRADAYVLEVNGATLRRADLTSDAAKLGSVEKGLAKYSSPPHVAKSLCWTKEDQKNNAIVLYDLGWPGLTPGTFPEMHCTEEAHQLVKKHFCETRATFAKGEFWANFSPLRNKAIHFCLSLSEELVGQALKTVDENLKEFVENGWLNIASNPGADDQKNKHEEMTRRAREIEAVVKAKVTWPELCAACGVRFLPDFPKAPAEDKA